jgi:hypothetical protein
MGRVFAYLLSFALLVLAGSGSTTLAQPLPDWQVANVCAKESAPGQCILFERDAQGVVGSTWVFVPDAIRQACLGRLKSPADHSWRLLAGCIEEEFAKARVGINTAGTANAE